MKIESGQVAVITGGASGIGLGLAHELGRRGMAIVVADVSADGLAAATAELEAAGIEALAVVCDVSSEDAVNALADRAFEWKGHVNVVCNNAGVVAFGPAFESLDNWRWVIDVDLWGVVYGMHAFVPRMLAGGHPGHVVNTSSTAGLLGFPNIASYVAAKHAVVGLSQSTWHELRKTDVSVSVLCPGVVDTNIAASHTERPTAQPDEEGHAPMSTHSEAMTPAEVAVIIADAIEADQFWILPHEHYGDQALELAQRRVDKGEPVMPQVR